MKFQYWKQRYLPYSNTPLNKSVGVMLLLILKDWAAVVVQQVNVITLTIMNARVAKMLGLPYSMTDHLLPLTEPVWTSGHVARKIGVSIQTVYSWERHKLRNDPRYAGYPMPKRFRHSGQRYFTPADLAQIIKWRMQVDDNLASLDGPLHQTVD